MSYNRFATPRAYMDLISYTLATGWKDLDDIITIQNDNSTAVTFDAGSEGSMFDLKPANYAQIANTNQAFHITFNMGLNGALAESNYLAILNHNFHDADVFFKVQVSSSSDFSSNVTTVSTNGNHTKVVNCGSNASGGNADFLDVSSNGWTLLTWGTVESNNRYVRITFKDSGGASVNFNEDVIIGSIMMGEYLDFPQSPELEIKTTIDYGGNIMKQSLGGNTYSSSTHLGQPTWSHVTPWNNSTLANQETYSFAQRHGRINHSLNFKYLDESEVFSPNAGSVIGDFSGWFDSDSLHNAFYNRILGQRLPFLFCTDGASAIISDYGLFRLGSSEFTATQVANRVYDVSMSLTETW